MKDKDFFKLAATNAEIDKEALRGKILSGRRRSVVFKLSHAKAAVAAGFVFVLICAAVIIPQKLKTAHTEPEDNASVMITKSDISIQSASSDIIMITSIPQDGEIVFSEGLRETLESDKNGETEYKIKVEIYSSDYEKYKTDDFSTFSDSNSSDSADIAEQYRLIEMDYFKSLGFIAEESEEGQMSFYITGKAGQILNLKIPKGKSFIFSLAG